MADTKNAGHVTAKLKAIAGKEKPKPKYTLRYLYFYIRQDETKRVLLNKDSIEKIIKGLKTVKLVGVIELIRSRLSKGEQTELFEEALKGFEEETRLALENPNFSINKKETEGIKKALMEVETDSNKRAKLTDIACNLAELIK